jgi:alanine racemase
VHVKLDTGMGRLGTTDPEEARTVAAAVNADDRLELAGLMTHFATADERGDDYLPRQLAAFNEFIGPLRAEYPQATVHAANSAATLRDPASHFDMVRCGIAVYGLDPFLTDARAQGLEPALSLQSYVAEVKRIGAGESVGYGRSWRAERDAWIGVLPIGYADGVRRGLSNGGEVLVAGRRFPLVATISMDNVTIDLGPETDVRPGAEATLIGIQGEHEITCEQVADALGTINYEVTCGIGPRVPRVHAGR